MGESFKSWSNFFLNGYKRRSARSSKRRSPRKRLSETQSFLKSKISRQVYRTRLDNMDNNIECSVTPPASKEHDYEVCSVYCRHSGTFYIVIKKKNSDLYFSNYQTRFEKYEQNINHHCTI